MNRDGSPPTDVRAVVFDLDGTLIDSYEAIADALNEARRWRDLPPLDVATVRRSVGHGLESLIERWVGPDVIAEGVRRFRTHYAASFASRTSALPDAHAVLATLRARGLRIAVASNKPARFSRPILEQLDMARFVDSVHGPDSVGAAKPDPIMIRRCLADVEVRPAQAVYVGDMPLDVESARRAGVAVALVEGGSSDTRLLREAGVPLFDRLGRLPDWLAGAAVTTEERERAHER